MPVTRRHRRLCPTTCFARTSRPPVRNTSRCIIAWAPAADIVAGDSVGLPNVCERTFRGYRPTVAHNGFDDRYGQRTSRGMPRREGGGTPLVFDHHRPWSLPRMTCTVR